MREDRPFILRSLANLLGACSRKDLLQLIRNGIGIRRAVPAIAVRRRHAIGIAAGERIFRLGKRADVDFVHRIWRVRELLRKRERRDDGHILRTAGRESAAHSHVDSRESEQLAVIITIPMKLLRQTRADQN